MSQTFSGQICVRDADDLETWLGLAPAVHAWISRLLGKDPGDTQALDTFWMDWREATEPAYCHKLLAQCHKYLAGPNRLDIAGCQDWLDLLLIVTNIWLMSNNWTLSSEIFGSVKYHEVDGMQMLLTRKRAFYGCDDFVG